MKRHALTTAISATFMVITFTWPSHAALYFDPDYSILTPVGRFGYAIPRSTILESKSSVGYFYFGPLGELPDYALALSAGVLLLAYFVYVALRRGKVVAA